MCHKIGPVSKKALKKTAINILKLRIFVNAQIRLFDKSHLTGIVKYEQKMYLK